MHEKPSTKKNISMELAVRKGQHTVGEIARAMSVTEEEVVSIVEDNPSKYRFNHMGHVLLKD
jgi:predicted transcriptional regulator